MSSPTFESEEPHSPSLRGTIQNLKGEEDGMSETAGPASVDGEPPRKPRNYQREMFEQSMQRNIIIAIETGGGKTHIAIMRIQAELERMAPSQRIWFLAPTVPLCTQQYEVISKEIANVQIKSLSGADDVDHWTTQKLWDAVLKNVKIVVSTYQILLDVLRHAFVRMEHLALIVFDEAHNCVLKHPGKCLMESFYHPRKAAGLTVPCILALTASPVMRSSLNSLKDIEATLDAVCRVPKKNRAELRQCLNLPTLERIYYQGPRSEIVQATRTMESLQDVHLGMQIMEDPYVVSLKQTGTEKSKRKLEKILSSQKTYCHGQVKTLLSTSRTIMTELGSWCADYYLCQVISGVLLRVIESNAAASIWDDDVSVEERTYLAKILGQVDTTEATRWPSDLQHQSVISDKAMKLIEVISQWPASTSAIIFVRQRSVVAVLHHLLSTYPATKHLKLGKMVGTSAHILRVRNVSELLDVEAQKNALSLFKSGQINTMIATSVLEEGIDVSACNAVFSFSKPANLKSFIQRRGRARQQCSSLILLLDSILDAPADWENLEAEMRRIYEDEMRALEELMVIEDEEDHDHRFFVVKETGARLDIDSALAHLHHFCATLPSRNFVDLSPEFICFDTGKSLRKARLILPLCVTESLRNHESKTAWKSEKNAIKDVAFEAYIALYKAGLINDNLLPLRGYDEETEELLTKKVETRASLIDIREQLDPWVMVAKRWKSSVGHTDVRTFLITIGDMEVKAHLPITLPDISDITLYWNPRTHINVSFDTCSLATATQEEASVSPVETHAILTAAFQHRFMVDERHFILPFSFLADKPILQTSQKLSLEKHSLIKDQNNIHYILASILTSKPQITDVQRPFEGFEEARQDVAYLSLQKLPRNLDFYHKPSKQTVSQKPHEIVLPAEWCTRDNLGISWKHTRIALLIPSLMRRLEVCLVADALSKSILKEIDFKDINLLVEAISASCARESTNYQRLEFMGDSILKLCTSVQLMDIYPLWPEGYLAFKKDRLVANSRLARAAIETGLDKFIITKAFTGHKWRPPYVDDLCTRDEVDGLRNLSSKIPADVVESLIGAAMIGGGFAKALQCLKIFLPELDWQDLAVRHAPLYQKAPTLPLPPTLEPLERLLGYTFKKKSLIVEAVTHASCNIGFASYERLEFLGDAILDHLVVQDMYTQANVLSHILLHRYRTALVNADFLAFLSMEMGIEQESGSLVSRKERGMVVFEEVETKVSIPLWKFMRHHSPRLAEYQIATAARHANLRGGIIDALQRGARYPWALLARLQAKKFFSDMVESIIGALWIDSGSFDVCRAFIDRLGILSYLRRILTDDIQVLHPKEEIGQLADTESVTYETECLKTEDGAKEFTCRLSVGAREVVKVDGGIGKAEVETRAAEMAVEILRGREEMVVV